MSNRDEIIRRLTVQIEAGDEVREAYIDDPERAARRAQLREWQAARLSRTYADLLASPRYSEATAFFLSDIYGDKDISSLLAHLETVLPVMKRLLPDAALDTVADAIELSALSEALDLAMVDALGPAAGHLTPTTYGRAYRTVGRWADRERQIELIGQLSRSLDRLTSNRMIGLTLGAMRRPARAAGLGELQSFLERGYGAFRHMGGANDFIDCVTKRETHLMNALFLRDDSPL
jgi:hypothetical protein